MKRKLLAFVLMSTLLVMSFSSYAASNSVSGVYPDGSHFWVSGTTTKSYSRTTVSIDNNWMVTAAVQVRTGVSYGVEVFFVDSGAATMQNNVSGIVSCIHRGYFGNKGATVNAPLLGGFILYP